MVPITKPVPDVIAVAEIAVPVVVFIVNSVPVVPVKIPLSAVNVPVNVGLAELVNAITLLVASVEMRLKGAKAESVKVPVTVKFIKVPDPALTIKRFNRAS